MFLTITDASKGKPYTLQAPIDNSDGKLTIGIRSISMWVGWYNIYEEQTWRWNKPAEGAVSTEIKLEAGLYSFSELVEILTAEIEGLSIMVNRKNGVINMIIPDGYELWLTDPMRYVLGLDDTNWLSAGEYNGDRAVEFSPKRILVYLKQVSTTGNWESDNQQLKPSQLLGVIPTPTESFGESFTMSFENPHFKLLQSGSINELDFDFKVEWGNDVKHKLDNHSQPIDLVLEIK